MMKYNALVFMYYAKKIYNSNLENLGQEVYKNAMKHGKRARGLGRLLKIEFSDEFHSTYRTLRKMYNIIKS